MAAPERAKYFSYLGLPETASQDDLRSAYKKLALKWHPDKNPSEEAQARFQEISMAYRVLSRQDSHKDYAHEHPASYDDDDADYDSEEDLWMYDLFENMFSGGFYPPRCNCPNCGGETDEWRRAKAQMRREERRRLRQEKREQARKEPKFVQQPPEIMDPPRYSNVTNSSATLRWRKPIDNGCGVDSFTMHVRIKRAFGGFGEWMLVYKGSENGYIVEDLAPGHSYQFRIRAHNDAGDCPLFSKLCDVKTTGKPPKTKSWKHPAIRSNLQREQELNGGDHVSHEEVKQDSPLHHHTHSEHTELKGKKGKKKKDDKFSFSWTEEDQHAEAQRLKREAEAAAAKKKHEEEVKAAKLKKQQDREQEQADREKREADKEKKEKDRRRAAEKKEREKAEREKQRHEAEERRRLEDSSRKQAEQEKNKEEEERKRRELEKQEKQLERQRKLQEQIEREQKRMDENLRRRTETQKIRDAVASLGVAPGAPVPTPVLLSGQSIFDERNPAAATTTTTAAAAAEVSVPAQPVSGAQVVAMAEAHAKAKAQQELQAQQIAQAAAPAPTSVQAQVQAKVQQSSPVQLQAQPQQLTAAQIAAKPSAPVVRKAAHTAALKVGSKDSKGRVVVDWDKYDHGMIFLCNNQTFAECLDRKLMGLPKNRLADVKRLRPGSCALFLYNPQRRSVAGVFDASGPGGLMLQPDAWKGAFSYSKKKGMSPFPAQIPFDVAAHTERVLVKVSALTSRGINMRSTSARVLDRGDTQKILQVFLDTLGLVSPSGTDVAAPVSKPAPVPRVPAWKTSQPLAVSLAAAQEKEQAALLAQQQAAQQASQQAQLQQQEYDDEEYDEEDEEDMGDEDQELDADDLEHSFEQGFGVDAHVHAGAAAADDDWGGAAPNGDGVEDQGHRTHISPSMVGASLAGPIAATMAAYGIPNDAINATGTAQVPPDTPTTGAGGGMPQQTCTFGTSCVQTDCMYAHPQGRPVLYNLLGNAGVTLPAHTGQGNPDVSIQAVAAALSATNVGSGAGGAFAAGAGTGAGASAGVGADTWGQTGTGAQVQGHAHTQAFSLDGVSPSHASSGAVPMAGPPPGFGANHTSAPPAQVHTQTPAQVQAQDSWQYDASRVASGATGGNVAHGDGSYSAGVGAGAGAGMAATGVGAGVGAVDADFAKSPTGLGLGLGLSQDMWGWDAASKAAGATGATGAGVSAGTDAGLPHDSVEGPGGVAVGDSDWLKGFNAALIPQGQQPVPPHAQTQPAQQEVWQSGAYDSGAGAENFASFPLNGSAGISASASMAADGNLEAWSSSNSNLGAAVPDTGAYNKFAVRSDLSGFAAPFTTSSGSK